MPAGIEPNHLLRAARKAMRSPSGSGRPMSRQEVADTCNAIIATWCDEEGRQSRWAGLTAHLIGVLERGQVRWPNDDYRRALRTLFDRTDAELGLYIDRPQPSLTDDDHPHGGMLPGMQSNRPETVDRWGAQYVTLTSGDALTVAGHHQESGANGNGGGLDRHSFRLPSEPEIRRQIVVALDSARHRAGGSVVDFFRERLERSKTDDGDLGPTRTLPVVLGTLGAISQHLPDVAPSLRRRLLSVGADGAEFAGWLYRDLLDTSSALYWYDRAMEWAQEADDTTMQAYVLLKKSQMAYDHNDGYRVMTFTEAAQRYAARLPLRVRAEITQQSALGMALAGEPLAGVERTFAYAQDLLSRATTSNDYEGPASAYFTIDTLVLRQAACYTVAGRPRTAAQLFAKVIDSGKLSRRDTGFFQARRAAALALGGEPDEAAVVGLEAVALATQTDSERTRRVLAKVVLRLAPWRTRPEPRALAEAIATPGPRLPIP